MATSEEDEMRQAQEITNRLLDDAKCAGQAIYEDAKAKGGIFALADVLRDTCFQLGKQADMQADDTWHCVFIGRMNATDAIMRAVAKLLIDHQQACN